jgi:hypothetical protein
MQTMPPKPRRHRNSPRKARPLTSREKVRAHRARLRAQGLRPITIWVPDTRSTEFLREARRQARLIARSPYAEDDQAFVDALSEWKPD